LPKYTSQSPCSTLKSCTVSPAGSQYARACKDDPNGPTKRAEQRVITFFRDRLMV
jgi:hypothetical protein